MNHQCKDCKAEQEAYDNWCADPGARGHEKPMPALPAATVRPVKPPGPRCVTHMRKHKTSSKDTAHERYVQRTYRMEPGEYDELYDFQGGACCICQRAKGVSKKLAVDHDHACCPTTPTCGQCTRGLLCGPCNKLLGHVRDDPNALFRGGAYLVSPPYRRMKERRDG